jgi:Delta7-sterol 5-desaturase
VSSTYLTGNKNFWMILIVIFLRYLILALVAFLIFYVFRKRKILVGKIQKRVPRLNDYVREIGYSMSTAVIFAVIGFAVFATPFAKFTFTYYQISEYGTAYLIFSIFLIILVHDTYFYWTHRWMHRQSIYKVVHRVHHLSTNPSPWAAMAFHPTEAVIEGMFIPIVACMFPIHPLAIGIFLLFLMIYNVYGHLGYELYPKGFSRSTIGKWVNTSVNHNQHHEYFKGNYGLYFLWWDRWMGTLREDYDTRFESVKAESGN